jgi:hypothetical protein
MKEPEMTDDTTRSEPHAQTARASFSAADWLRAEITLRMPRWMILAAGIAAFVLLLAALD